jgi:hypothetical protein
MGKVVDLNARRDERRRRSAAISAIARNGLVEMSVGKPTFTLTPEEAEAWAERFTQLARTAREDSKR